jgi:hypothetical protein
MVCARAKRSDQIGFVLANGSRTNQLTCGRWFGAAALQTRIGAEDFKDETLAKYSGKPFCFAGTARLHTTNYWREHFEAEVACVEYCPSLGDPSHLMSLREGLP